MKQNIQRISLAVSLVVGSLTAGAALAQQQSGLVNVNLETGDVLTDIANDLSVNVSQIPVNVQVPVGVAANVCNVDANVLAQQAKNGDATCNAQSTSTALNQVVQRQMNEQNTQR